MPYQNYLSLWEFQVMHVIFCKLVFYLSWCQGSYPGEKGWDAEFCFLTLLTCSLWTFEFPTQTLDFELLFSSFSLISGKMDYFISCLTGPSAAIAGGQVLVLINTVYSCNNFAWEPSWICLACSQYNAVSHWYSEGKAINTLLSLANDFYFFF